MRLSKDDTAWKCSSIKKRDFRHTHDGPEVAPWKKKKKKKRVRRCNHNYDLYHVGSYHKKYRCKGCGKIDWRWKF